MCAWDSLWLAPTWFSYSQFKKHTLHPIHYSQNGKLGQNGELGHSCVKVTKGRLYNSWVRDHVTVHLGLNVSSSAHNCGCVVDGGNAMAVI